jgi:hypothetical protein
MQNALQGLQLCSQRPKNVRLAEGWTSLYAQGSCLAAFRHLVCQLHVFDMVVALFL